MEILAHKKTNVKFSYFLLLEIRENCPFLP